jgi:hypothetical protein
VPRTKTREKGSERKRWKRDEEKARETTERRQRDDRETTERRQRDDRETTKKRDEREQASTRREERARGEQEEQKSQIDPNRPEDSVNEIHERFYRRVAKTYTRVPEG